LSNNHYITEYYIIFSIKDDSIPTCLNFFTPLIFYIKQIEYN
jgi:hypothetical protein